MRYEELEACEAYFFQAGRAAAAARDERLYEALGHRTYDVTPEQVTVVTDGSYRLSKTLLEVAREIPSLDEILNRYCAAMFNSTDRAASRSLTFP